MTDAVPHHDDVVLAHRAGTILDFVAQLTRFENDHFEVIRPMHGDIVAAIQDQESHIDRACVGEGPDVRFLSVDLAIDKRIDVLPSHAAFRSHERFTLRNKQSYADQRDSATIRR
jgi:hypothetical protein